jgi:hypothetical protein
VEVLVSLGSKSRSAIYAHLSPILGEEVTDEMLSNFPVRDLDEPVTKDYVRAEIASVRSEIADLRAAMEASFRRQTQWLLGAIGLATAVAGGIASLG